MIAYPDTSFFCALYVPQRTSAAAIAAYKRLKEPLAVSALLLGEFRQSVRFQIFRNSLDATQGYGRKTGMAALAALQANLEEGALELVAVDWADVLNIAERVSNERTARGGQRFLDILHVATALHLGAREFLSCDTNQCRLAKIEGLSIGV